MQRTTFLSNAESVQRQDVCNEQACALAALTHRHLQDCADLLHASAQSLSRGTVSETETSGRMLVIEAEADARVQLHREESAAVWEMLLVQPPARGAAPPGPAPWERRLTEAEAVARQTLSQEEHHAALGLQGAAWEGLCQRLRRDLTASEERCEGLQGAVLSKQQMVEQLLDQVWGLCACGALASLSLCVCVCGRGGARPGSLAWQALCTVSAVHCECSGGLGEERARLGMPTAKSDTQGAGGWGWL